MICHPGNRCGKVDHHASMIQDEQDSNKRVTLLQEFGDIFMHFVQAPVLEKKEKKESKKDAKKDDKKEEKSRNDRDSYKPQRGYYKV